VGKGGRGMKVRFFLSIGYTTAEHEDIIELPDSFTQEDIEAALQEWANNYIEIWSEVL
jgi:hypothetical protein